MTLRDCGSGGDIVKSVFMHMIGCKQCLVTFSIGLLFDLCLLCDSCCCVNLVGVAYALKPARSCVDSSVSL